MNNTRIATIILNTIPEINEQYIWTPQISNNCVPGLESLLTYINSKYPTLSALQNEITTVNNNINNTITNEITNVNNTITTEITNVNSNIETEI